LSILFGDYKLSFGSVGRDQASRKPVTIDFLFSINIQPADYFRCTSNGISAVDLADKQEYARQFQHDIERAKEGAIRGKFHG